MFQLNGGLSVHWCYRYISLVEGLNILWSRHEGSLERYWKKDYRHWKKGKKIKQVAIMLDISNWTFVELKVTDSYIYFFLYTENYSEQEQVVNP